MGEGIKLPECERPAFSLIAKRLDDRVNKKLRKLFVEDIQNDCICNFEKYDTGQDENLFIAYLDWNSINYTYDDRHLCLPMSPDISDAHIISLLSDAGAKSHRKGPIDLSPRWMLYNPNSDMDKVLVAYSNYLLRANFELFDRDTVKAEFVPPDQVWFIPDPEFFGCISVNIDKFGAFCIPNQIRKEPLQI